MLIDDPRLRYATLGWGVQPLRGKNPRIVKARNRDGETPLHDVDSGGEALSAIRDSEGVGGNPFAVLLTDLSMPTMGGLEFIKTVRRDHPDIVPAVITGYGTIETAVKAIRYGAIDFLTKPIVDDELRLVVEKAVQQHTLFATNANLRRQLEERYGLDNIVGADRKLSHQA